MIIIKYDYHEIPNHLTDKLLGTHLQHKTPTTNWPITRTPSTTQWARNRTSTKRKSFTNLSLWSPQTSSISEKPEKCQRREVSNNFSPEKRENRSRTRRAACGVRTRLTRVFPSNFPKDFPQWAGAEEPRGGGVSCPGDTPSDPEERLFFGPFSILSFL